MIVPVFERQYHHITVAQKRKSDLSFSVSGADLRWKSRRIIVDDTAPVRAAGVCLSEDNYLSIFEGEIRRQEYFNFHSIRITFAGAGTVCDVTETGRAGFLSLWWSSEGRELYDAQSKWVREKAFRTLLCQYKTFGGKSVITIQLSRSHRESSVHQGLGFTLIKFFERPKHLPLYLFSFWNLTLTRHITSVYYQTIPKRMWFWLTGWRKNRDTIDSLTSSVLQESFHDSRLELSDGRWDYTSAIILECLLFLLALCNVNAAGAN